ncbi:MAG: TIGR02444 family protein [Gammaproteobacteria bacterium]
MIEPDSGTPPLHPQTPLWDFSVQVYTREGVETACLDLQDRFGLNVNMLLFAVWMGFSGRGTVGHNGIRTALTTTLHWHASIVEPLRRIRRLVQSLEHVAAGDVESLRRALLHNELASERIEQEGLAHEFAAPPSPERAREQGLGDAMANLSSYLDVIHVKLDANGRRALCLILHAAFPGTAQGQITRQCNRAF